MLVHKIVEELEEYGKNIVIWNTLSVLIITQNPS